MADLLTPFWSKWRRARIAEYLAEGFDAERARRLAKHEAQCRMAATKLIGREAALDCDVSLEFWPDKRFRGAVIVNPDSIPAQLLPRAQAWATPRDSTATH